MRGREQAPLELLAGGVMATSDSNAADHGSVVKDSNRERYMVCVTGWLPFLSWPCLTLFTILKRSYAYNIFHVWEL